MTSVAEGQKVTWPEATWAGFGTVHHWYGGKDVVLVASRIGEQEYDTAKPLVVVPLDKLELWIPPKA